MIDKSPVILIHSMLLLLLNVTPVFAGAAVQRQQQMKAMQEQAQEQAQQQYIQAYQQAQQEAYVQAVQQQQVQAYQQAVAQQQQAAQIEAARQYVMQQQAQLMIQAQINRIIQVRNLEVQQQQQLKQQIEQELARRVAMQVAQGQAQQIQQAMVAQVAQEAAQQVAQAQVAQVMDTVNQARAAQTLIAGAAANRNRPFEPGANDMVQEVVDITQVWDKLAKNSKAWSLLIDTQAKVMTVNEFIERYRKDAIRIQKPPIEYVHMIDDMAAQNPQMLLSPFKDVLQLVAIMEYDFDNGMDKDMMAQKILGQDFYLKNRRRLGK